MEVTPPRPLARSALLSLLEDDDEEEDQGPLPAATLARTTSARSRPTPPITTTTGVSSSGAGRTEAPMDPATARRRLEELLDESDGSEEDPAQSRRANMVLQQSDKLLSSIDTMIGTETTPSPLRQWRSSPTGSPQAKKGAGKNGSKNGALAPTVPVQRGILNESEQSAEETVKKKGVAKRAFLTSFARTLGVAKRSDSDGPRSEQSNSVTSESSLAPTEGSSRSSSSVEILVVEEEEKKKKRFGIFSTKSFKSLASSKKTKKKAVVKEDAPPLKKQESSREEEEASRALTTAASAATNNRENDERVAELEKKLALLQAHAGLNDDELEWKLACTSTTDPYAVACKERETCEADYDRLMWERSRLEALKRLCEDRRVLDALKEAQQSALFSAEQRLKPPVEEKEEEAPPVEIAEDKPAPRPVNPMMAMAGGGGLAAALAAARDKKKVPKGGMLLAKKPKKQRTLESAKAALDKARLASARDVAKLPVKLAEFGLVDDVLNHVIDLGREHDRLSCLTAKQPTPAPAPAPDQSSSSGKQQPPAPAPDQSSSSSSEGQQEKVTPIDEASSLEPTLLTAQPPSPAAPLLPDDKKQDPAAATTAQIAEVTAAMAQMVTAVAATADATDQLPTVAAPTTPTEAPATEEPVTAAAVAVSPPPTERQPAVAATTTTTPPVSESPSAAALPTTEQPLAEQPLPETSPAATPATPTTPVVVAAAEAAAPPTELLPTGVGAPPRTPVPDPVPDVLAALAAAAAALSPPTPTERKAAASTTPTTPTTDTPPVSAAAPTPEQHPAAAPTTETPPVSAAAPTERHPAAAPTTPTTPATETPSVAAATPEQLPAAAVATPPAVDTSSSVAAAAATPMPPSPPSAAEEVVASKEAAAAAAAACPLPPSPLGEEQGGPASRSSWGGATLADSLEEEEESSDESPCAVVEVVEEEPQPTPEELASLDREFGEVCGTAIATLEERLVEARLEYTEIGEALRDCEAALERWRKREGDAPNRSRALAAEEEKWRQREAAENACALALTRTLVPPGIEQETVESLRIRAAQTVAKAAVAKEETVTSKRALAVAAAWGGLYTHELAGRLKRLRALYWVQQHVDDVACSNFLAGAGSETFKNLGEYDVIELRAIYASCPLKFERDQTGAKALWRSDLVERLQALVARERGEVVASGWDGELDKRRMVALPPVDSRQRRAPEYFYSSTTELEVQTGKYEAQRRRLEQREQNFASLETRLVEARDERDAAFADARSEYLQREYGKPMLRQLAREADDHFKSLTAELNRTRVELDRAKRAVESTQPPEVDFLQLRKLYSRHKLDNADNASDQRDLAALRKRVLERRQPARITTTILLSEEAITARCDFPDRGRLVRGPFDPWPTVQRADRSETVVKKLSDAEEALLRRQELEATTSSRQKLLEQQQQQPPALLFSAPQAPSSPTASSSQRRRSSTTSQNNGEQQHQQQQRVSESRVSDPTLAPVAPKSRRLTALLKTSSASAEKHKEQQQQQQQQQLEPPTEDE